MSEPARPQTQPDRYRALDRAAHYDARVRSESLSRRISRWAEMRALRCALARVQGARVLDVPCGTGRIQALLTQSFGEQFAVDSSAAMLAMYRTHTATVPGCVGDAFRLPFADRCFDWVVCSRLLHHFSTSDTRAALLAELARVSGQGVIVTAWMDTPTNRRRGSRRCSVPRAQLEAECRRAGLDVQALDFVLWPLQPKCVLTAYRWNAD